MTSPNTTPWQDRRSLFQRGKEVHEPGRRASVSSSPGTNILTKVASNDSTAAGSSSASERRRSSITPSSPTSGAMFAALAGVKRGSQDYGTRRTSMSDQHVGGGSAFSGWYASTFKGAGPQQQQQQQQGGAGAGTQATQPKPVDGDAKRGVME